MIELEDPLAYLTHRPIIEVRRGVVIYDQADQANGLYLVVRGRVALARDTLGQTEAVVDVLGENQLFGFGGLLHVYRIERALAVERCGIMFWTTDEILQQIERKPRLGIALIQAVATRMTDDLSRIQALSAHTTPERLVHMLLLFSERFGHNGHDGAVELPPLPHQLLSDCIAACRGMVTVHMNRLRRKGYLTYSRRETRLHLEIIRDALRKGLFRESRRASGGEPEKERADASRPE
jgi:CRP/FNR family transcriptional regulator